MSEVQHRIVGRSVSAGRLQSAAAVALVLPHRCDNGDRSGLVVVDPFNIGACHSPIPIVMAPSAPNRAAQAEWSQARQRRH
jgi:hypothetical protein